MITTYKELRDKWKEMLIGRYDLSTCDEVVWRVIRENDKKTKDYLESMNQENDRAYLWEDKADFKVTQTQTDCYKRLLEMSRSYSMQGSLYYQDKALLETIRSGLKLLYEKAYNTSFNPYYGNWWNWEIGTPIALGNILCLLWDELLQEERSCYANVIYFFQPNPRYSGVRTANKAMKDRISVGGNRVDTAKVALLLGMITEDENQLMMARDALSDTFKKVSPQIDDRGERRDGLYEDWSFIQHGYVPYTGTYGNVLLGGIGEIVSVLTDTKWQVVDSQIENIYEMILHTFAPVMYKGHCMEIVNGRGASREEWKSNRKGHSIINSMMWFVQFVPQHYKIKYQSMIKYWIQEDKIRDYIATNNNIHHILLAQKLLADTTIEPSQELIGTFSFNSMDRIIHHRDKFTFALSMHSSRIRTYEYLNGENRKGFYTSDGMTYIYNGDQEEYTGDFWATIDPYKLSGITVDLKKLEDGEGSFKVAEDWVSTMACKGCYGIAGMQLNKKGINELTEQVEDGLDIDLRAKKSYFMLDSEVVALGADICSSKPRKIETIVDTRKMKEDFSNQCIVTDKYIYLESNDGRHTMGYYFPEEQEVEVNQYIRRASWHDVNDSGSWDIKEQAYLTVAIQHGQMPKAESYAYILVPNITLEEISHYAKTTKVQILENNECVQAIRYKDMIMANIWRKGVTYLEQMKVSGQVSIVIEESEETIGIWLCDPTKCQKGTIDVELLDIAKNILNQSKEIEVIEMENTIKIKVQVEESRGKMFHILFQK